MSTFQYSIYSGAENTFAILDCREKDFPIDHAKDLCDRCNVDGALLLEKSTKADFFMRTINRDGSEAGMCGNGLRSLIRYVSEKGNPQAKYQVETPSGIHYGWLVNDEVCVQFPPPRAHKWDLSFFIDNTRYRAHWMHLGVPHLIYFVDDLEKIDVAKLGAQFRHHPDFAPLGTNVTFATSSPLAIRTYERGVEAETRACGTAAVAAALVTAKLYDRFSPIEVKVRSNEILTVSFTPDWSRITLRGPAHWMRDETFTIKQK